MKYDKESKTITLSQNTGVTVSLVLIIMFTGAVFTVSTWVGDTRRSTQENTRDITTIRADVVKLQAEGTDAKVKLTEIQTQLKGIDTSLVEIKEALRK